MPLNAIPACILNKPFTTLAVAFSVSMGSGALVACSQSSPAHDEAHGPAASRLTGFVFADKVWTSPKINVCWETGEDVDTVARGYVKSQVEATIEPYTRLDFVGWGDCTPSSRGIRLSTEVKHPRVKAFGRDLDGVPKGILLPHAYSTLKGFESCALSESNRENCIRSIAAHEFMHAVGVAHEQDRPDHEPGCTEQTGTTGATPVGKYDPQSIMNYCNPAWSNQGFLTSGDIRSLEVLYGDVWGG